ncbi:MAG: hypothetical protein HUU38_22345, partial [Anaerolineales bacterium]|nr:hypothetical protein [Anaerolineales bacterium]
NLVSIGGGGRRVSRRGSPHPFRMGEGWQNILIRGVDLSSAWLPTGILLAYAAGIFALAVWRFRKMAL